MGILKTRGTKKVHRNGSPQLWVCVNVNCPFVSSQLHNKTSLANTDVYQNPGQLLGLAVILPWTCSTNERRKIAQDDQLSQRGRRRGHLRAPAGRARRPGGASLPSWVAPSFSPTLSSQASLGWGFVKIRTRLVLHGARCGWNPTQEPRRSGAPGKVLATSRRAHACPHSEEQ